MDKSIGSKRHGKIIRVMSCGFKFGAPPRDAALVVDCRGFKNPHYDTKLRPKTGASKAVADFLTAEEDVRAMLAALPHMLGALLPGLMTQSRYHPEVKLVFACTGGKHRSRFFALAASETIRQLVARHPEWQCRVVTTHRDLGRE